MAANQTALICQIGLWVSVGAYEVKDGGQIAVFVLFSFLKAGFGFVGPDKNKHEWAQNGLLDHLFSVQVVMLSFLK